MLSIKLWISLISGNSHSINYKGSKRISNNLFADMEKPLETDKNMSTFSELGKSNNEECQKSIPLSPGGKLTLF